MPFRGVTDFNVLATAEFTWGGPMHSGEAGVRLTDTAFAAGNVPALGGEVSGQVPNTNFSTQSCKS